MATRMEQSTGRAWLVLGLLVSLSCTVVRSEFNTVQEYFSQWEDTMYGDTLYPFGEEYYDTRQKVAGIKDLTWDRSQSIPFFGGHYQSIGASPEGFVKFSSEEYAVGPSALPMAGTAQVSDPAIVAAFLASTRFYYPSSTVGGGGMFYRSLMASGSSGSTTAERLERDVELEMMNRLKEEVQMKVAGAYDFEPSHVFIITWANVTLNGCPTSSNCPNNTFQVVILTDTERTYTILNYHDLSWLNDATFAGCDSSTGMGSNCRPAQMGFNAGNGLGFYGLPYSGDQQMLTNLPLIGRFLYEVSGDVIMPGSCIDSRYSGADMVPTVYPQSGNMLGGYQIHITGYCVQPNDMVQCRYGSETSMMYDGLVIDTNRVSCPVPFMTQIGEVAVYVYVSNQLLMTSHFVVESPDHASMGAKLVNEADWYTMDPMQLDLQWTPEHVYWPAYNTNNQRPEDLRVHVELHGIREASTTENTYEWKLLEELGTSEYNDGTFVIMTSQYSCTHSDCNWDIGVVKIYIDLDNSGSGSGANSERMNNLTINAVWSKPVPLAWYTKQAMINAHGNDWADVKCDAWKDQEPVDDWADSLPACPCTRKQAYTTSGEYIVGAECGENEACPLDDASYFVVQVFPSSDHGLSGGSVCTYDSSDNLVYAGDEAWQGSDIKQRSYSFRRHPDGQYPYTNYGQTPSLSHWLHDKVQKLWCCEWASDDQSCLFDYAPRRPTSACSHYNETGHAVGYGDPHFTTFDGSQYTFNGFGEYTLLKLQNGSDEFHLQGRMLQLKNDEGMLYEATSLMAVAMQDTTGGSQGPKVQVQFTGTHYVSKLAVFVDGVKQDLTHWEPVRRMFRGSGSNSAGGVVIANEDADVMNNITVYFDTGVAIQVAASHRLLHVSAKLPHGYYRKTSGLMGKWNGEMSDDLSTLSGSVTDSNLNRQTIHSQFGQSWVVSESSSLFTYTGSQSWNDYQDPDFVPVYDPQFQDGTSITQLAVNQLCGTDTSSPCYFDYIVMEDSAVAQATRDTQGWSEEIMEYSAFVSTCTYVSTDHCIRQVTSYLEDGQMVFSGAEEGYELSGHSEYTCQRVGGGDLRWTPDMNTKCKEIGGSSNATAIAVALVVIILIIIILVLLFIWYRRRNAKAGDEEDKPKPAPATNQQQPPQQHHLSKYPDPYINEGLSQSTSSVGSVVLTEELHSARPPRPKKEKKPKLEPNGMQYDNQAADVPRDQTATPSAGISYFFGRTDNPVESNGGPPPSHEPRYGNIPPTDRSTPEPNQPHRGMDYPKQASQGYDNPVEPDSPGGRPPVRYMPRTHTPQHPTGHGVDTSV